MMHPTNHIKFGNIKFQYVFMNHHLDIHVLNQTKARNKSNHQEASGRAVSSWLEWGSHPWWSGGPLEHTTDTFKIQIWKDFLEKNGVVEGMFGYVFFFKWYVGAFLDL